MTDVDRAYEARFERKLRAFAEVPVRPFDADAIARETMRFGRGPSRMVTLLVAAVLVLLVLGAVAWTIGSFRPPPPIDARVSTTPSATAAPSTPAPSAAPVSEDVVGSWLADVPGGMSFGGTDQPVRMSLIFDAGGTFAYVALESDSRELAMTGVVSSGSAGLRFETRGVTDPITVSGATVRGCEPGEAGTYRVDRSSDGFLLTLEPVVDPCPSRAAVMARTWMRSLSRPNGGGPGVIDSLGSLFTVELPAGSYTVERSTDAITVVQEVPEFQFLAFRDPQGFIDPCDPVGGGRFAIAPGADPFVAYFRQLAGFTVDSTEELIVDGHRAVRLVITAAVAGGCPGGRSAEWQPRAQTGDQHWFLRPGDSDSLILVERSEDVTLMFEVLPAPNDQEDQVIGSIRFLEELPTSG